MPLSEHEQKLLDQMERALYAEDPSFATQMKGHGRPAPKSRLVAGVVVAVLGLAVVVLGVSAASIPLGVVGFVIMVAGVAWAATPQRVSGGAPARPARSAPAAGKGQARKGGRKPKATGGSFMQRLDERWEKRRRDGI